MKERIIRILVNALLGALASIATIYAGGSALDAASIGAAASGSVGDVASSFVNDVTEALRT